MACILLIHWKETELTERIGRLERAGHDVEAWHQLDGAKALRDVKDDSPDAIVIDLGRLPSHGREVGVALRTQKSTRSIPPCSSTAHRRR